ncbi:LOW QUALITY PROTEIN: tetraspanin-10 [Pluvialis apricaria]
MAPGRASRLVELPYSSSDDDDGSLARGHGPLPRPSRDPGAWCPATPKLSTFSQCVRYLAFFWNLLFLLLGLLALAVGVWGLLAKGSLGGDRLAPLGYRTPMLFFVLVGLGASAVSLAACLGALRTSPCLLLFFVGGLAFAALEVLGGCCCWAVRHRLRDALQDALLLCLLRYQEEPDLRVLVDEVQRSLRCCVGSYRDWETNPYFNCSAPGVQACSVPASCCLDPLQNGTVTNTQCAFGVLQLGDVAASTIVHLGGCVAQLSAWFRDQAGVASQPVRAVLVLVEAAGVLMALKMLRDIAPVGARD